MILCSLFFLTLVNDLVFCDIKDFCCGKTVISVSPFYSQFILTSIVHRKLEFLIMKRRHSCIEGIPDELLYDSESEIQAMLVS